MALSSLVAGYLLTVGEIFGLEDLREGVGMEITHRKEHGQWLDYIRIPAQEVLSTQPPSPDNTGSLSSDPIPPFDNRVRVVDEICDAAGVEHKSSIFISRIRDLLLDKWSKESVLSELETQSSRQASVSESRLGNGAATLRTYLSVGNGNNGRPGSVNGSYNHHSRPGSRHGVGNGVPQSRLRTQTAGGSTTRSSSSRSWTVKVDELKAVLAGQSTGNPHGTVVVDDSSSASECQSYTSSDGEELIIANGGVAGGRSAVGLHKKRSQRMHRRETIGSEYSVHHSEDGLSRGIADNIPPVPRLPSMVPGAFSVEGDFFSSNKENGHAKPASSTPVEEAISPIMTSPTSYKSSQQQQHHSPHPVEGLRAGTRKVDVQSFLSGIDAASNVKKRPGSSRGVFKPPY